VGLRRQTHVLAAVDGDALRGQQFLRRDAVEVGMAGEEGIDDGFVLLGRMLQVAYTRRPPGRTSFAAPDRMSPCLRSVRPRSAASAAT
jgi:hypothetical protein